MVAINHKHRLSHTDFLNSLFSLHCPSSMRRSGYHRQYSGSLKAGWSMFQILVGTRFSTSVLTSPEAHPASCTMRTVSSRGKLTGVWQLPTTPF